MDTRIKVALTAAAGTTLLVGGYGSLAFWNDAVTGPGTEVNNGELSLSALDCGTGWHLDDVATGPAYVPATTEVSPGEELEQVCTTTITALGDHLEATLSIEGAAWVAGRDAALENALQKAASFQVAGAAAGTTTAAVDELDDGKLVTVTMTVTFPFGVAADNAANDTDLATALDDVDLTLVQDAPTH